MPELPDVEVFRRYLDSTGLHKKIENVDVKDADLLGEVSSLKLKRQLNGSSFENTDRHGKYLFARSDNDSILVLHFGMTGFLKYFKNGESEPEHTRLLIDFENGYSLAYDCQRKLGLIELVDDTTGFIEKQELGPDFMDDNFKVSDFTELIQGRRGSVKSALMNQEVMAGIGNVYSDEILFHAGIHPETACSNLSQDQVKELYRIGKEVLEKAISSQVEPEKFPTDFLITHREPDTECPQCGGTIKKETISGRSSYFCDKHQEQIK